MKLASYDLVEGLFGPSLRYRTQLPILASWPLHRDHISRSAALHGQDGTVASGIRT